MNKWQLHDPLTDDTYIFPVNPYQDNGSFAISKNVGYSANAAYYQDTLGEDTVSTIVYSTGSAMENMTYSGKTYTQAELDALEIWCSKDYILEITDDLLRTHEIMVDNFSTTRIRSNMNPYKHEYKFSALVIREV